MNREAWITEERFQKITRITKFESLSDEEISGYADIVLDLLYDQLKEEKFTSIHWCPKCETHGAVLEVDEHQGRGIAYCGFCRLTIVVFYREDQFF